MLQQKSESKTGLQGEANVGLHPQNTTNEIQMVYKQLPLQSVLPGFVKGNLFMTLPSDITATTTQNDLTEIYGAVCGSK